MKKIMILFLTSFACLLTSCGNKTAADAKPSSDDSPKSIQTRGETETAVLVTEAEVEDGNAAYEEYLNSLRYLDEVEAKLSEAVTTIDMAEASHDALEAWDKELNRIYALLIETLPDEQREELKTVQRLWIKEKDKLAAQYADSFEGGTFYQVAYNDVLLQFTKERTLELISVYFNNSDDFSFDLSLEDELPEENPRESNTDAAVFHVYDVDKKYYNENGNYLELDLKLPRLEGDYDGIPAINEYFVNKEPFFYEQLPWDILDQSGDSVKIEGKKDGYFVSAYYYLETQIGDIISIPAVLDGGAGGVSWAGMEGNTFDLNTGEKLKLSDLFRVSEEEYMGFIYDYVTREIAKDIKEGGYEYFFQDAYSEEGAAMIRSFNQDNFIVSSDALFVFYDKYELAVGAAGVMSYEIPYESIKEMLAVDINR